MHGLVSTYRDVNLSEGRLLAHWIVEKDKEFYRLERSEIDPKISAANHLDFIQLLLCVPSLITSLANDRHAEAINFWIVTIQGRVCHKNYIFCLMKPRGGRCE